jgi:hypothetical protein
MDEDIEYLDEKFPKGKSKLRGEAMVLLAKARMGERKRCLEIIEKLKPINSEYKYSNEYIEDWMSELIHQIQGEKND